MFTAGTTNYQGSASEFAYPKITAPITTIALNPTTVAFGNRTLNTTLTKTVQLTNTGSINWSWDWAATDNGDVNMPSTTCGSLKPGENCTVTISYKPSQLAAITAHITLHSNFGNISIPVTGTGVAPAPTVTAIRPHLRKPPQRHPDHRHRNQLRPRQLDHRRRSQGHRCLLQLGDHLLGDHAGRHRRGT